MKTIVENISTEFNITKKLAKEVVEATINAISASIIEDGEIRVNRLGTFKVKTKLSRKGHNPKTGEAIIIPEKKVIKFTIAASLKEAIA